MSPTSCQLLHPAMSDIQLPKSTDAIPLKRETTRTKNESTTVGLPLSIGFEMVPGTGVEPVRSVRIAGF